MKSCLRCLSTYPSHFSLCPNDGTVLIEAEDWFEGMLIRGKYRILKQVGKGGMGAVYKAHHVLFDELRALKVMKADLVRNEVFAKRFKQEAVIARKLNHPNAVRVDDIDEAEDGRPFIVMEYIEGVSLRKVIQEEGRLTPPRACFIAAQVAGALDAAHRIGMVHRDIKPANIVLVPTPEGEQAKVLDFGIAKVREVRAAEGAGSTLTGTGIVVGTPQYMSPEQALGKRGDELDGRSDLYSLGIVLYQMLTGDLPFNSDTTIGLLLAHINSPPRPILEARPDLNVPASMAQLVMTCLEKKPEMRPANAATLIKKLQRVDGSARLDGPTQTISATWRAPAEEVHQTMSRVRMPDTQEAAPSPVGMPAPRASSPAVTSHPAAAAVSPLEVLSRAAHLPGIRRWIAAVIIAVVAVGAGFAVWRFEFHPAIPARRSSQPPVSHPTSAQGVTSATPPGSSTSTPRAPLQRDATGSAAGGNLAGKTGQGSATATMTRKQHELQASGQSSIPEGSPRRAGSATRSAYAPEPEVASSPDVVVLTAPGVAVFMDGKRVGTADANGHLAIRSVKPGSHMLRLTLAGFPDLDDHLNVPPGEGGTSTLFVSTSNWSRLQARPTVGTAPTSNESSAPPSGSTAASTALQIAPATFGVVHVHRLGLGSCKGTLVIGNDSIQFRADNKGKDSFSTPLDGTIWGPKNPHEFYLRLPSGKDYTFRAESAPAISAAIYQALSRKSEIRN